MFMDVASEMTTGLGVLSTVTTHLTGQVSNIFTLITSNWLAMLPIGVILGYTVVKFAKKLIHG